MHHTILASFLAVVPAAVLGQATSRLRTRTSTGAVCTNTPVSGPLPTSTFVAMLLAHPTEDEDCPRDALLNLHYHDEDDVGCCTQSATLTVASGTPACCACGATCTGSVPSVVDWAITTGQFITTAATGVPSVSGATPTATGTMPPATTQTGQQTASTAGADAATVKTHGAAAIVGLAAGILALL